MTLLSALGVATIVAYGVAYYSCGALIDPIRRATGWSTTALGATFSAVLVIGGVGGLFGGSLADRLGTRPVFVIAAILGASGIALASIAAHRSGSHARAGSARAPSQRSAMASSLGIKLPKLGATQRGLARLSVLAQSRRRLRSGRDCRDDSDFDHGVGFVEFGHADRAPRGKGLGHELSSDLKHKVTLGL